MRNLTLGTIIVAGGLLAAIPFRRDAATSDTTPQNTLATGPTSMPFATPTTDPLIPPWQNQTRPGPPALASATQQLAAHTGTNQQVPMHRGAGPPTGFNEFADAPTKSIPTQRAPRMRRDTQLPLTYDDLAVPLSNPHFPDRRYNALAEQPREPVRTQSHDPTRTVRNQPPTREDETTRARLASSTPTLPQRQDNAPLRPDPDSHRSFRIPDVSMPAAPPPPSVMERQRHWIKQPD